MEKITNPVEGKRQEEEDVMKLKKVKTDLCNNIQLTLPLIEEITTQKTVPLCLIGMREPEDGSKTVYTHFATISDTFDPMLLELCKQLVEKGEWHSEKEVESIIYAMEEGADQWRQDYSDCRAILQELVDLKVMKETGVNLEYYTANKPAAWEAAKRFLEDHK